MSKRELLAFRESWEVSTERSTPAWGVGNMWKAVTEPFFLWHLFLAPDAKRRTSITETAGESMSLRDGRSWQDAPLVMPPSAEPLPLAAALHRDLIHAWRRWVAETVSGIDRKLQTSDRMQPHALLQSVAVKLYVARLV